MRFFSLDLTACRLSDKLGPRSHYWRANCFEQSGKHYPIFMAHSFSPLCLNSSLLSATVAIFQTENKLQKTEGMLALHAVMW